MLTAADIDDCVAFAGRTARAAGTLALRHFRSTLQVDDKSAADAAFDPVTVADRAVERYIRTAVAASYPDDGILGEEEASVGGTSGRTWVIDPIDGTRAFMTGMLHWGVLLALHDGQQPLLGVMYQPYTDELFVGRPGRASLEHGSGPVRVLGTRACARIDAAVFGATSPQFFAEGIERTLLDALCQRTRMVRFGGDCYLYAMLAAGHIDLVCEAGLAPYDIQALIPLVRGAGGVITDWRGGDAAAGGRILAAGDARLHAAVLALVDELDDGSV